MKKHTDSGFTFDIKEDHAAVIEIDGNPQIVGNSGNRSTEYRSQNWLNIFFPGKAVRSYGFLGSQENWPLRFL